MAGLSKEEKKAKCLACGSTSHIAKDCTVPGSKRKEKETAAESGREASTTSSTATTAMGADGTLTATGGQRPMKAIAFESPEATEMKSLMTKALEEIRRVQVLRVDGTVEGPGERMHFEEPRSGRDCLRSMWT